MSHFKWAHWIDSLFSFRFCRLFRRKCDTLTTWPKSLTAIINNNNPTQYAINCTLTTDSLWSFTLRIFCKQCLKLVHIGTSWCERTRSTSQIALINIQVESLTLSFSNPLVPIFRTSFSDYVINYYILTRCLRFEYFPPKYYYMCDMIQAAGFQYHAVSSFSPLPFQLYCVRRGYFACLLNSATKCHYNYYRFIGRWNHKSKNRFYELSSRSFDRGNFNLFHSCVCVHCAQTWRPKLKHKW